MAKAGKVSKEMLYKRHLTGEEERVSSRKIVGGTVFLLFNVVVVAALPWIGPFGGLGDGLQSEREISASFLAEAEEDKLLVFFGYVGCGTVCPVSMASLRTVYTSYRADYPEETLGVIFIGLPLPGEPILAGSADHYAKFFHEDFRGYDLSSSTISQAVGEFGISFAPSLTEPAILNHSAFIYLLQRSETGWGLKRTYIDSAPKSTVILADLHTLTGTRH